MKKYEAIDPYFAELAKSYPLFRPRSRFFYSEREAEQDAYFWFLQGQRLAWERDMEKQGLGHINEALKQVEREEGIRQ